MYDAIISIKPIFVEKLISGKKEVELRNRPVNLPPGCRLWIYSTLPKACIQAMTYVFRVDVDTPENIWKQYNSSIGVSKKRYHGYVNDAEKVSAILVKQIWKLPYDLPLQYLRNKVPGFHPPQFFKYMNKSDPLLSAIVGFLLDNLGIEYCENIGINRLLNIESNC